MKHEGAMTDGVVVLVRALDGVLEAGMQVRKIQSGRQRRSTHLGVWRHWRYLP
jgi:translation elongation factor EF-4